MDFPPFIEELVKEGIEITIEYSEEYGIYFNLNTGTKSHVHLVFNGVDTNTPVYIAYMRYDGIDEIWNITDIYSAVKSAMYGRNYITDKWAKLLVKHGFLKKKVTTTITYE